MHACFYRLLCYIIYSYNPSSLELAASVSVIIDGSPTSTLLSLVPVANRIQELTLVQQSDLLLQLCHMVVF